MTNHLSALLQGHRRAASLLVMTLKRILARRHQGVRILGWTAWITSDDLIAEIVREHQQTGEQARQPAAVRNSG